MFYVFIRSFFASLRNFFSFFLLAKRYVISHTLRVCENTRRKKGIQHSVKILEEKKNKTLCVKKKSIV